VLRAGKPDKAAIERARASRIALAEAGLRRLWKNTQHGACAVGKAREFGPRRRAVAKRHAALPARAFTE
jgi:hypothetical protein